VTVVICLGLTAFSFQTKYDFTMMGGSLFCILMVFTLFGILAMFIRIPAMQMVLAAVGAIIFSVYLVYDTQLMIGGKHKMSISPEEYVFAALNIYMDVIMIFLYILRLLGSRE
jgi:FtsH-binding integral membrane protein